MGAFLRKHFRAAWKKVGTFVVVKQGGKVVQKQGGNVVAYFCTPDLEVVHAVTGNVGADTFLAEAKWAAELWKDVASLSAKDRAAKVREAHSKKKATTSCGSVQVLSGTTIQLGTVCESVGTVVQLSQPLAAESVILEVKPAVTTLEWKVEPEIVLARPIQVAELSVGLLLVAPGALDSVHSKLSEKPLPSISDVERYFFEEVLGEKLSDKPVQEVEMERRRRR